MHAEMETNKDQLAVKIYADRDAMGRAAAGDAVDRLRALLKQQEHVWVMFAAAPSQAEFLEHLTTAADVAWERVTAFHLDEYVGLPAEQPQRFGNFLDRHIFGKVPFRAVHYIDVPGSPQTDVLARYAALLKEHPLDMACIGIGENGHIAFNDPHVADFSDPECIKVVDLDEQCRRQQVNDGCFAQLDDVPAQAYTVTIPTILSADYIFCMVPGAAKAKAVERTVNGPIEPDCPASVLRSHQRSCLYLDAEAGRLVL